MVVAAALLAACDEKQEPAAAQPKLPSTKRFTPDRPATPKPGGHATPPPAPVDPPVAQQSPPLVPPAAPAPPPPAPALSAAEREAQRAEQRQQRVARISEQMTSRLKERDANGDGLLTQNELSGGMQRGFTRADTNGDGSLDPAEQQAMIQSVAERMGNSDRGDRRGFAPRGGGFGGRRRDD